MRISKKIIFLVSIVVLGLVVTTTANAKTAEDINLLILNFLELTTGNLTVTDNATLQQYPNCDFITTDSSGTLICGTGNISISGDGRMGTDSDYLLYNTSSYILLNMTRLNETIDSRAGEGSADGRMGAGGYWLYNDTSLIYINGTRLNETIDARAGGGSADGRMGTNDMFLYNDTSYIYMNTTTITDYILYVGENHFFTGLTSGTHNGSFQFLGDIGYEAANRICDDDYEGSHMCQAWEIVNTINVYGTSAFAGDGWISEVAPGYTADMDDCRGWTSDSSSRLGSYFKFTDVRGAGVNCANEIKIACCGEYTVPV